MLSTLSAWTVIRGDGSMLVAALYFAEGAVLDGGTSIAFSVVAGLVGMGVTVGMFRQRIITLESTTTALREAIVAERAAREKAETTWEAFEKSSRDRLTVLETKQEHATGNATAIHAGAKLVASSIGELARTSQHSDSPRSRDHESTTRRPR